MLSSQMMLLGDEARHTTEVLVTSSYCSSNMFNHKLKLDLAFLERKIRLYVILDKPYTGFLVCFSCLFVLPFSF